MMLFAATLFVSALLLFAIQPLMGRFVLPWFGGSPTVWTTCMLFFQFLLLAGYGYAHLLSVWLAPRVQAVLHSCLVTTALLTLPLAPTLGDSGSVERPVIQILRLLMGSIGMCYLVLSATAPLLQRWLTRCRPGASPYPLYSLSNLGSLIALLSYPCLLEPGLGLGQQAAAWSWAFMLFAGLTLASAVHVFRVPGAAPEESAGLDKESRVTRVEWLMWLLLPACGSMVLLATTNQMCLDVAVVPLLWILPLSLYLLSFILCFHSPRWYPRSGFAAALVGSLALACHALHQGIYLDLRLQIASYSIALFVACMVCHGELVRLKPAVGHLTAFYLMVAAGGAIGGLLVTVVAPRIFAGYWEYHLSLLATAVLFLAAVARDPRSRLHRGRPLWAWSVLYCGAAALCISLVLQIRTTLENSVTMKRGFFGVLRVLEEETDDPEEHRVLLMHGRIEHGFQFASEERRYWPTSYFGPDSGVGLAIRFHPKKLSRSGGLRMGVVGLGTGTLATYGEPGDYIRFYEINPEVLRLSDEYFSYRRDSGARIDVVLGDARVSMEREKAQGKSQGFDVLAVDAFAGDAIPVHLLTLECYRVYRYHLKEDGILALHLSNRYFDLGPVARNLAAESPGRGTEALWIAGRGSSRQGTDSTDWVLLTANREFLNCGSVRAAVKAWPGDKAPVMWTDDYANLFALLSQRED
jgi:hypothetical protein